MRIEKTECNIVWFSEDNVKIRAKSIDEATSIIWVSIDNRDVNLTLVLYDFLLRCDEDDIDIGIDKGWNERLGFYVKNESIEYIISYVIQFILTWKITSTEQDYLFHDEEWFQC